MDDQDRHAKTVARMRMQTQNVKQYQTKNKKRTRKHKTKQLTTKQSCGESEDYFKAGGIGQRSYILRGPGAPRPHFF